MGSLLFQPQAMPRGLAHLLRLAVAVLGCVACAPVSTPHNIVPLPPEGVPPAAVVVVERPGEFSVSRAWRDLEEFHANAPTGRAYLRSKLDEAGLVSREIVHGDATGRTSLLATFDGDAPSGGDLLLFVAPFGGELVAQSSAAAVVLELARALVSRPRIEGSAAPYGFAFLFVGGGDSAGSSDASDPREAGRTVAASLADSGLLQRTRAGFYIDRLCAADLQIARDLNSSRSYREVVWSAARDLGHTNIFRADGFETLEAGHRAFQAAGVHQMVALIGSENGSSDALESCSSEGIAAVGAVVREGAARIESRLHQIDQFAKAPAAVTALDPRERQAASWSGSRAGSDLEQGEATEVDLDDAMRETPALPGADERVEPETSPPLTNAGEES